MTIEIPNWAMIGTVVKVKDIHCDRGDDPNRWYKEKIISYGYNGVFTQAPNCPSYYFEFSEYGKTIKENE